MKSRLTWVLLILFLASCTAPIQTTQVPTSAVATGTIVLPASSPVGAIATATAVSDLGSIPAPFTPFSAKTNTENVLLRANPGVQFEPKTTLTLGLQVTVLYRAPGDEWIFVQTPFDSTGWINSDLLNLDKDLKSVPFMLPADVQAIKGRVVNERDEPVTGISFGILESVEGAKSFTALTDANGVFYAYIPATAKGAWSVTFDKASCKSNTMDSNCNCIGTCGTTVPESSQVTLPQADMLVFEWR